jgi:phytoene synthase
MLDGRPGEPIDWRACREITSRHSRTFYRASQVLGPRRRRAIHATYAFCRYADDLVDLAAGDPASVRDALSRWEREIDTPTEPVSLAFTAARREFAVPAQPARDLIRGVRMDIERSRFATWVELREYCYLVAGTVGLLVAPILGCRDESALVHAVELGIAMQLTNIIRDVAEDGAGGRLYLPLDEMQRFGCDPEAILAGRVTGDFQGLIAFQIERARQLFAQAELGIPALCPAGRFATLVARHFYAGILSDVERRECDLFQGRAVVSAGHKLRLMPRVVKAFVWMPFTGERSYAVR